MQCTIQNLVSKYRIDDYFSIQSKSLEFSTISLRVTWVNNGTNRVSQELNL